MTRFACFAFATLAFAACDPYAPDLGPNPFECGGEDDVCPEGYTCDTTRDVCQKTEPQNVDAPAFTCQNDAQLEPNNTPAQAYIAASPGDSLLGLAICPNGDVDHYQITVDAPSNLELLVAGMADRQPLQVDLLNRMGTVISSGTPVTGAMQQVKLEFTSNRLAADTYVIRVRSSDATENNYNLTYKTCTTPLPCP